MATASISLTYTGIAPVPTPDNQLVINLPYSWFGATALIAPTVSSQIINYELDAFGNHWPTWATLSSAISSLGPSSGGIDVVTLTYSNNLQPSTTAIAFSVTLNFDVTHAYDDTLDMTCGMVITNPMSMNYSFPITVSPSVALQGPPTVTCISSNTTYPGPAATMSTAAIPIERLTKKAAAVDTNVTIPVAMPPGPANQTYLVITFILQLVFSGIGRPEDSATDLA
jgi:hypothetical protein